MFVKGEFNANTGIFTLQVFLESELNTTSLQTMVWARNLFDARNQHPRFYRRSEQDVSNQLPSFGGGSGGTIQYPELLSADEKLHPGEILDVVLRPADARYVVVLVANKRSTPSTKSVIIGTYFVGAVAIRSS